MKAIRTLGYLTAGLAGTLALGACGSSGPSTNTNISQSQAEVVGSTVAAQVGAIAGALGQFRLSTAGLGQGFFGSPASGGRILRIASRAAGPRAAARLFRVAPPSECIPGVTGDSTDSDLDGIPNNVIYTFTSTNCSYTDTTDTGDTVTVTVTGTVALRDTDGGDTFFGYTAAFGQWKYRVSDGISTIFLRLNGTSAADVGTTAVSGSDHYSFTIGIGADNATLSQNWDASYTPDAGQVVDSAASSLPPGEFDLNGTFGFSGQQGGQSGDWSFTLLTAAPLAFDPGCAAENQLVGGSLQGAISARQSVGFTIDFQGCGMPPAVAAYGGTS